MTELTLTELAEKANVTRRTIRYYIQQGLLPSPEATGRGAHYDQGYVDRLRLIKKLKDAHLPLAEIRARIGRLSDEEIRNLLNAPAKPSPTSAREYIRSVLEEGAVPSMSVSMPDALAFRETTVSEPPVQSRWQRYTLDPDIEIHVRRPLSRHKNEILSELLDAVRELLEKGERS